MKSHIAVFCLTLQAIIVLYIEDTVTATLCQGRYSSLRLANITYVLKACNMMQITSLNLKYVLHDVILHVYVKMIWVVMCLHVLVLILYMILTISPICV
jgi:hypothetical protein